MRFALIDQAKEQFPVQRLCSVLGVSQSGYFAWKDRPACRRQRDDLVLLAHARSAFALSNGTYGSPRMTRELQDNGFAVGRRRTARLMRENDIKARQKRRFKRTTDSEHSWPVAPNIIDQDFAAVHDLQQKPVPRRTGCLRIESNRGLLRDGFSCAEIEAAAETTRARARKLRRTGHESKRDRRNSQESASRRVTGSY